MSDNDAIAEGAAAWGRRIQARGRRCFAIVAPEREHVAT